MTADALPADASICRNCGVNAPGAFCPACGQETDTRLPTLRKFMHDATGRLVSFDSRFWRTVYGLVAKPGFLTREYLDGRRRRYIRPTRLFLVMSVVLFAVIRLEAPPIQLEKAVIVDEKDKARIADAAESVRKDDIAAERNRPAGSAGSGDGFNLTLGEDFSIVVEGTRNPFNNLLRDRLDRFNHLSRTEKGEQITAGMLRYGPYAMFALLPAFAWLQQLAYLGRSGRYQGRPRKYIEHLVYAAHIHTFLFLVASIAILIHSRLDLLLVPWALYYIFTARQAIYRGSRWGGFVRGMSVMVIYTALFVVATIALFFAAIVVR